MTLVYDWLRLDSAWTSRGKRLSIPCQFSDLSIPLHLPPPGLLFQQLPEVSTVTMNLEVKKPTTLQKRAVILSFVVLMFFFLFLLFKENRKPAKIWALWCALERKTILSVQALWKEQKYVILRHELLERNNQYISQLKTVKNFWMFCWKFLITNFWRHLPVSVKLSLRKLPELCDRCEAGGGKKRKKLIVAVEYSII